MLKAFGEQIMIDGLIKIPERHASFPPRAEPTEWEVHAVDELRKRIGDYGHR